MKKRLFFTFLLLLTNLMASAYDCQVDGIYYNLNSSSKTAEVTDNRSSDIYYFGRVNIPSSVSYDGTSYSVTSIGNQAFLDCDGLTSVTIPNSVTSIGNQAFLYCDGLTSINIPEEITSIGETAFGNCNNIQSLYITDIKKWLQISFGNSYSCPLTSTDKDVKLYVDNTLVSTLDIPDGVTTIPNYAFRNCSSLTSINIPEGVTSIGSFAFSGCSSLTSVTIPNSVTSIGNYAFSGCSSLTSVTIDRTLPLSLYGETFSNRANATLYVPAGSKEAYEAADYWKEFKEIKESTIYFADANVKAICVANWDTNNDGELSYTEAAAVTDLGTVFKSNTQITSFDELQYFTGLTSIGYQAFYSCSSLTSVTIPNSVTSIGIFAFSSCSGLTSVTIPNSITTIGECAFRGCSGLTSLTIPNSVTSIGEDAFRSCSGLTSVNISNSLTDIGRVFIECSGLEAVTIPDGVESIGEYAFDGCTSLTSLTISQSVTSINNKAFLNCGNLETIVVDEHNTTYDSRNHCNAIIKTSSNTFVKGCKNTIIPEDITFIGNYAFYGCNNLSITSFPESVSDFGEYAFASATINEIVIPTSVTYIGKSCFSNATINRVEIPYSETPIRYSCREGSNYAYTVFTGATIGTLIIDRLLSQVSSSEYVAPFFETKIDKVYEGIHGKNWYSSSTIQDYYYPEGITDVKQNSSFKYMGSGMYYSGGNSTIERQHIPEGVTTITKIYLYPENPNNTPSVNIPSTVTTIAADAFESNMYNTLVLPAGIQSIGERAFANITSVKSITCLAENPIEINENVFPSNAFTKPLYVPVGSKGLYEAASGWSNFSNIIEIGELGNPIQFADPEIKSRCVKNYDVNGDGELSEGEALLVTSIKLYDSTSNSSNSSITSFDELGTYFTNLTSIDYYAFGEFRNMTSITIPNSVTSIGVDAFYDCRSLTTVTIPSNVTSIAATAFRRSGLSTIVVDPNNTTYDSRDNCNAIIETASNTLVLGCKNTVIPNSVTSIGEMAFSGCSGLTALNIPNSVTSIGDYAFESCNGLTSVTIPSSVASIGNSAFRGCSGLTSVTIDRTQPLSIDSYTFSNRANATLYVPAGSKEAYEAADYWKEFKEIKEIKESTIYFADANVKALCVKNWDTDGDGELSKDEAAAVTDLGEVFKGNEDITSFDELQYFTGLTTIGENAFRNCINMTSVTIPSSVTSIGDRAFSECKKLSSMEIPDQVTTIGLYAFSGLTSNQSLHIGRSLSSVYGCSFANNAALTSITVDEENATYDSRNNCNAVIETATNKLIVGCQTTVIPEDVTTIGNNAFWGRWSMASIEIPANITVIEPNAFSWCISLRTVDARMETPCTLEENTFDNIPEDCVLYVPAGTKAAYIAKGWTEDVFKGGIIEAAPDPSLLNTLAITDVEACKGSSVLLPVFMNNTESIKGIQFEMTLPAGVSVATDADDVMMFTLTSRAHSSHAVSATRLSNGDYRVVVSSLSARTFSGTEGDIMNITLNVADNVQEGEYEVKVHSIVLNTAENVSVEPADATATLTVKDIAPGDVNGDVKINVTDVGMVIDDILENTPANFVKAAADLNGDGKVNVTDVGLIIDIILSDDEPAGARKLEKEVDVDTLDPQ